MINGDLTKFPDPNELIAKPGNGSHEGHCFSPISPASHRKRVLAPQLVGPLHPLQSGAWSHPERVSSGTNEVHELVWGANHGGKDLGMR